jgi:hypothetical protein
MAGGIVTGAMSTHMTALAASTPWAGITERVNIYGTMLWLLMLSVVLLRPKQELEPAVEQDGRSGLESPGAGDSTMS